MIVLLYGSMVQSLLNPDKGFTTDLVIKKQNENKISKILKNSTTLVIELKHVCNICYLVFVSRWCIRATSDYRQQDSIITVISI